MNFASAITDIFNLVTGGTLGMAADAFAKKWNDANGFGESFLAIFSGAGAAIGAAAVRAGINVADLLSWFMDGTNYRFATSEQLPSF